MENRDIQKVHWLQWLFTKAEIGTSKLGYLVTPLTNQRVILGSCLMIVSLIIYTTESMF